MIRKDKLQWKGSEVLDSVSQCFITVHGDKLCKLSMPKSSICEMKRSG